MTQKWGASLFCLIGGGCLLWTGNISATSAQTNAWTNSASGYWEQPFWSAGVLPGTNQIILFTNAWQALAIGASTVATHPETLQVEAVTVAAPSNSFNELLLNYPGFDSPFVVGHDGTAGTNSLRGSLVVATNSAMVMLSSALEVNNSLGGAFSIGGTFSQGD